MCLHCGHLHRGKEAPQTCPVCQRGRDYMIREGFFPFAPEIEGENAKNHGPPLDNVLKIDYNNHCLASLQGLDAGHAGVTQW